ncbi:hypothetical protein [Streptomyces sp. NPDC048720]|uniref:hypothetical protein n=1 Tax=Streptomyces sp. NPDC048720 TaxID=3365588 RepID=UPI0037169C57
MDPGEVAAGRTQIVAPQRFMEHAVAENVFAVTAMARRAGYMCGPALTKGPQGQIGTGLGQTVSIGEPTLIPPTVDISGTGQQFDIDGVRLVFQLTPGTEAPAEMNFYLPDHRALRTAENTSHTLHNILTIRGAQVCDARAWFSYLTETIGLWGRGWRWCLLPITGPPGDASGRWGFCAPSATCTPTCTTRRCGCVPPTARRRVTPGGLDTAGFRIVAATGGRQGGLETGRAKQTCSMTRHGYGLWLHYGASGVSREPADLIIAGRVRR